MLFRNKILAACVLGGSLFLCPSTSFGEQQAETVEQTESLKEQQRALIEKYNKEKDALKQSTQFKMESAADKKARAALMREGKRKQKELERAFKSELRACKNAEKKLNPRKGHPEIEIIMGEDTGGRAEPNPWGGKITKNKKKQKTCRRVLRSRCSLR